MCECQIRDCRSECAGLSFLGVCERVCWMESERIFLNLTKLKSHDVLKLGGKERMERGKEGDRDDNKRQQEDLCAMNQINSLNIHMMTSIFAFHVLFF